MELPRASTWSLLRTACRRWVTRRITSCLRYTRDAFPDAGEVKLETDEEVNRSSHAMGSDVLENEYYRVAIERATGRPGIFDKELNRTVEKTSKSRLGKSAVETT